MTHSFLVIIKFVRIKEWYRDDLDEISVVINVFITPISKSISKTLYSKHLVEKV